MSRGVRRLLIAGAVLATGAIVAAAAIGFGGTVPQVEASSTGLPPATAKITEGTLTQTQSVSGTLSYGPAKTLTGKADGTITWLPAPGSVIKAGDPLYKIDNDPVLLFTGKLPPYRTLSEGDKGPDVKQLEKNLTAMGYDGIDVDSYFGSSTTEAVYDWQDDHGLPENGEVGPGQLAVSTGPVRIAEVKTSVGAGLAPGAEVITYTGTERVVEIALAVDKQQFVEVGNPATVVLPNGSKVKGTVSDIGAVASTDADGNTTIPVTVSIKDQKALGTLEAAPVTVQLITGKASNVLIVPVTALVALAGGGYGVQVVSGGQVDYVAVKTGMFAGGMVQISGAGIAAGTVVGVAS
ncbi:peptidoglycan-binding protein [Microlunatus speluncae]|uniref:peptidoglycan-binding protein n=1 Tax=Microlunatus speluncae TaxID=2594267 RepID=UPI00126614F2|nr:peptidoglycan-binding protein [Microlunatus speluncae]